MKQLAELDKIDSGEEENDDKDEDEEFEEVMSPQKGHFRLGCSPREILFVLWDGRDPPSHHNTGKDAAESAHNSQRPH